MKKTVIIAAGGTGGHIYPALAIAAALRAKDSSYEIFFVGTRHGLENELIPKEGYPVLHLPIGRLHKSVSIEERIKTLVTLPFAIFKAMYLCLKIRPQFLLGVGGHASGPMLLAGSLLRYKTVIWEPNAQPGLANRILSRFVSAGIVVFDRAKQQLRLKKVEQIGFPVRKPIEDLGFLGTAESKDEKMRILVYMGSQGAQSMNSLLPQMLSEYPNLHNQVEIIHQTGKKNHALAIRNYEEAEVSGQAEVVSYIDDMNEKYKWADLIVCRSGTGTLSELAATGKPSVLIPLPYASDDHQKKNAEVFVESEAAVLIEQKNLTTESLQSILLKLKNDPQQRQRMAKAAFQLHNSGSAAKIAEHLMQSSSKD